MNTITFSSGGSPIRAESYSPAIAPSGTAVVIAHGSDGITDHLNGPWATMMRDYANAFSQKGCAVLMPYYFERTGTEPGQQAMLSMFAHMAEWQQTLADALTVAAGLPGVTGGRVALVGFSLGGHLSLRLRGNAAVVVEFFAPYFNDIGTSAKKPHIQIHHGEADGPVNIENARQIEKVLKSEGVVPDLKTYPRAGHGFDGRSPGDAEARKLSRERTVEFLGAHL